MSKLQLPLFLAGAFCLLPATTSFAIDEASFSASADFRAAITSITLASGGDAIIGTDWDLEVIEEDSFSEILEAGLVTSSHSSAVDVSVADGSAMVDASVSLPFGAANGIADSIIIADLTNLSTEALTVVFEYELNVSTDAVATFGPGFNSDALSYAEASISLTSSGGVIGDILDDFISVETDALFGDPPASDSISNTFTLNVAPGATVELDLYAYADGFAVVVPEPSSVALFGVAIVGLVAYRRRK